MTPKVYSPSTSDGHKLAIIIGVLVTTIVICLCFYGFKTLRKSLQKSKKEIKSRKLKHNAEAQRGQGRRDQQTSGIQTARTRTELNVATGDFQHNPDIPAVTDSRLATPARVAGQGSEQTLGHDAGNAMAAPRPW